MANHVNISVIGRAEVPAKDRSPAALVEHFIEHWQQAVDSVLPDKPDLIVVPELCDHPCDRNPDELARYYAQRGNAVRDVFARIARENHCYITYPAMRVLPDDTWRNAIQLIDRNGKVMGAYDKNFPTISEIEQGAVVPGREAPLFDCDFGTVACAICFDLNFDELRTRIAERKPDLVVFCSMYHGGLVQPYWAYACRAHLASAVAGLPSQIYSPQGQLLAGTTNYFSQVSTTVNLDCALAHLDDQREKLVALKQHFGPAVCVSEPGLLGSVLITSRSPQHTARQMLTRFDIITLDAYLDRSRAVRQEHLPAPAPPGSD